MATIAKTTPLYRPSHEERQALDACKGDLLWRGVMGLVLGVGTGQLVGKAVPKLQRAFMAVGALSGGGAGVLSARGPCLERLLRLENSPLADRIRQNLQLPPQPNTDTGASSDPVVPDLARNHVTEVQQQQQPENAHAVVADAWPATLPAPQSIFDDDDVSSSTLESRGAVTFEILRQRNRANASNAQAARAGTPHAV